MAPTKRICSALLLFAVLGICGALNSPPTRRTLSRRSAVAAALPFMAVHSAARAVCVCPSGLASCVCTEDDDAAQRAKATQGLSGKKRADAAGRDTATSRQQTAEYRAMYDAPQQQLPKKQPEARPPPPARAPPSGAPPPPVVQRGGLTGGGSMEYGEMDVAAAKARFNEILYETVARREADYGFELDAADIKNLEGVLRIKYCGREGLIGPC
jgi:hypothetical protein